MKVYRKNNREKLKQKAREYRASVKKAVFNHYGKSCKCCGESTPEFLTIDHINGGGCKHRHKLGISSGTYFYTWLIKNNFPSGYEVLCYNCNCGRREGVCPHKLKKGDSNSAISR